MHNRENDKLNHRYHLKKAKESVENAKLMALLAKDADVISVGKLLQFSTLKQQLLAIFLLFHVGNSFAQQIKNEPTCTKKADNTFECKNLPAEKPLQVNLNIVVDPGIESKQCTYIKEAVLEIKSTLPNSTAMLNRVLEQKDFQVACVDAHGLGQSEARYDHLPNAILYPALNKKDADKKSVPLKSNILHHEFIHADTSRRHRTPYCGFSLFNEQALARFKNQLERTGDLQEDLSLLTAVPIWPPTEENLLYFRDLVRADLKLNKIENLKTWHEKVYKKQSITKSEQERYDYYRSILKNIMMYDHHTPIPLSNEKITFFFMNPNSAPKEMMAENLNVVYKDIKLEPSTNRGKALTGIIADPVSTFLYACNRAISTFHQLEKNNLLYLAIAELDAHLRTGLPDEAIKEFFPNLWTHLQQEEACCDKGDKTQCYTPK